MFHPIKGGVQRPGSDFTPGPLANLSADSHSVSVLAQAGGIARRTTCSNSPIVSFKLDIPGVGQTTFPTIMLNSDGPVLYWLHKLTSVPSRRDGPHANTRVRILVSKLTGAQTESPEVSTQKGMVLRLRIHSKNTA